MSITKNGHITLVQTASERAGQTVTLQRRNGAYGGCHIKLKNTASIRHGSARRDSLHAIFLQQPVKVERLLATLQFVTHCG